MPRTAEKILAEAKTLPTDERIHVAEELLRSVEGVQQAAIDAAWAEEADRRADAYREGQATSLPVDDALREIRQSLKERRQ
jgi:putative addiction module component (TIGR02574 family)